MRQLVYIVFISNNHALFHLWKKKNLVEYQKVSKYYDHDCLQIFLLLFMSLLTVSIVQSNHILAETYFIFMKRKVEPQ